VETWLALVAIGALQLAILLGFVMLERREPQATLAWILTVVFLPVLGAFLYLVFGFSRTVRRVRLGRRIADRTRVVFQRWQVGRKARGRGPNDIEPRTRAMVRLAERGAHAQACTGNRVELLVDARSTYDAMRRAFDAATHHIHVEFYIIQPDQTGRALRDHLVERARAGIEVRVLCDAIGSIRLPRDFWESLVMAGGHIAYYAPIRLGARLRVRRRDRINFRNHRKNVVVDGVVGFTGGINIGREYLGLDPAIGSWRDTHVEIRGPAVIDLQKTFVEDWLVATGELLDAEAYFPELAEAPGDAVVQVVASGPDRPWAVIHQLFVLASARSDRRLWVTSPYFVPDAVMKNALVTAALAGADVRLLVPKRSDNRLVDLASRHHFPELLEAGVQIHEYAAGFLHAKTIVVDDWLAVIGSTNMDIRSFQLNYELTAFVYDRVSVAALETLFLQDLEGTERLPRTWARDLGYGRRLLYACAGLMSPLL
jgi:cardiolipin synthase